MALTSGTKLGPYEILAPIGAGGMGEVYRARDPELNRDVAVKILPPAFSADADRLRRFKQEAQATAALNHPNILALYHVGQQDGSPYLVSELLEGESLRQRLQSGPLPVRKTADYAAQVARGLAAAHDKGIIHRDLKPENIFLTRDGRAKILDFGLAKLIQPEEGKEDSNSPTMTGGSEPGVALGTVGYMSPEQVRGLTAGPTSDLFSFGAILYEMLTGKRAFHGATSADTMSAILKEDPPEFSETARQIPPALDRIVRHCLEKNPEERFQSARDVAFDLEALSGLSAATSTVPTSNRVWLRNSWLLVLVLLFVGVGIGLILGKLGGPKTSSFRRLTFRRGSVLAARFAPDGQTVVYDAIWEPGSLQSFSIRLDSLEARPFDVPQLAISAVSVSGEMAVLTHPRYVLYDVWRGTLATMPLGGGAPREILEDVEWADWAPDGKTLAAIHVVGYRQRLEFPIGRMLYESSGWISHPRISPKGDRIAFLDHPALGDSHGALMTVDLTGKSTTLSQLSSFVQGLAWSPRGSEIWFTSSNGTGGTTLSTVKPYGKVRLVMQIPGSINIHDISRDGRVLLTRDDVRAMIRGLLPGQVTESDSSWLDSSWVDDLSPDGKLLLFDEEGEGGTVTFSSYLRNTDALAPVRLGDGDGVALSPDRKSVISVLPGPSSQLSLLPTGAGTPESLQRYGLAQHDTADWLPDGKGIVFTAAEPGHGIRIYLQKLDGGRPTPITPEGVVFQWPSHPVSPDGRYLIARDSDRRWFVYPIEGDKPKVLPGAEPDDFMIRWCGDGHSIFVHRFPSTSLQIYKLDVNTGSRILVHDFGNANGWPVQMTPDGKYYAYTYSQLLSDLYLVDGLE